MITVSVSSDHLADGLSLVNYYLRCGKLDFSIKLTAVSDETLQKVDVFLELLEEKGLNIPIQMENMPNV